MIQDRSFGTLTPYLLIRFFCQWIYRIIVSCSRKVFEYISGWLKVFYLRLVEGLSVIEGLFKFG